MGELIAIVSGKGGTGKTSLCAGMAQALAEKGEKVLCIDCDVGMRNLDIALGLSHLGALSFQEAVEYGLDKAAQHPDFPGIRFLTAPMNCPVSAVDPADFGALLQQARQQFDYILLDCPAGIEQGFKNAIAGADRALVVTTPEVSAIRDADRIIGLLEANDIRDIQLIINRLRPDMIARGDMMSVEDVTEILAVDLIGTILDDEQIVIATNQGEPLSGKSSQAEEEYRNICQRIIGENVPFMNIAERKSFFRKIGNMFRK